MITLKAVKLVFYLYQASDANPDNPRLSIPSVALPYGKTSDMIMRKNRGKNRGQFRSLDT